MKVREEPPGGGFFSIPTSPPTHPVLSFPAARLSGVLKSSKRAERGGNTDENKYANWKKKKKYSWTMETLDFDSRLLSHRAAQRALHHTRLSSQRALQGIPLPLSPLPPAPH